MKIRMPVLTALMLFMLTACVLPAKTQSPDVAKRAIKTSQFLASKDHHSEGKSGKNLTKTAAKKAKEKTEVKTEAKSEEKKTEVKESEVKDAEVKVDEAEVKTDAPEKTSISEYPIDKYSRRAFSGFTKEPDVEEVKPDAKSDENTATEEDPEKPLYEEQGLASWYGPGFHGHKTANGEDYNQNALTAAHRKYPLGTKLEVTNLENGKTVTVRVNDRGPYSGKRIIDLSKAAAKKLDILHTGVAKVGIKQVDE